MADFVNGTGIAVRVRGMWHGLVVQKTETCSKTKGQVIVCRHDSRGGTAVPVTGLPLTFRKGADGSWDHVIPVGESKYRSSGRAPIGITIKKNELPYNTQCVYGILSFQ